MPMPFLSDPRQEYGDPCVPGHRHQPVTESARLVLHGTQGVWLEDRSGLTSTRAELDVQRRSRCSRNTTEGEQTEVVAEVSDVIWSKD